MTNINYALGVRVAKTFTPLFRIKTPFRPIFTIKTPLAPWLYIIIPLISWLYIIIPLISWLYIIIPLIPWLYIIIPLIWLKHLAKWKGYRRLRIAQLCLCLPSFSRYGLSSILFSVTGSKPSKKTGHSNVTNQKGQNANPINKQIQQITHPKDGRGATVQIHPLYVWNYLF